MCPLTVLHIPRRSPEIPREIRGSLLLSGDRLDRGLVRIPNWYTGRLHRPKTTEIYNAALTVRLAGANPHARSFDSVGVLHQMG